MFAALDCSHMSRVCYVNAYPYCLAGKLLSLQSVRQTVKLAELERKGGKANTVPTVSFKLNSFPVGFFFFFLLTRTTRDGSQAIRNYRKVPVKQTSQTSSYCSAFKLH